MDFAAYLELYERDGYPTVVPPVPLITTLDPYTWPKGDMRFSVRWDWMTNDLSLMRLPPLAQLPDDYDPRLVGPSWSILDLQLARRADIVEHDGFTVPLWWPTPDVCERALWQAAREARGLRRRRDPRHAHDSRYLADVRPDFFAYFLTHVAQRGRETIERWSSDFFDDAVDPEQL